MNFFKKNSSIASNTVVINGKPISVAGNNISVINDKVYVDGKLVEEGLVGHVTVEFKGDLANLEVGGAVNVIGNVQGYIDAGGSVSISGNVSGNVDAAGSVTCSDIKGDVDAGGSVRINK